MEKYRLMIGPYIRDELTELDKRRFEEYLESSEELRKELKMEIELHGTINGKADYDQFRKSMEEAQQSFFQKHKKKIANIILFGWCFAA
ncbi:MAG: hypothetical protein WBA74_12620 [Cyclobacteriaceae bacterium]